LAQRHGERSDADLSPQLGVGKSLLFSAVLLLAFFLVAELGVRGWVYFAREGHERFDLATETFVLVPGEYRGEMRINSAGFVGDELQPDAPDLFRIYALGDSCTFNEGSRTASYPALLGSRLSGRTAEGLRYEVVNAGVQGLNSQLALNRLRSKGPEVGPEIVTIYIGWNDLMKFDPTAQGTDGRWAGVARALDRLWLVKGLRKLVFFHVRPLLSPPKTGPESRTGRFRDFVPAVYEANLREIVRTARELGARPLLLTLPTVVREDMTADELRAAGVMFPYFPGGNAVGDFLDLVAAYNRAIRRVAAEEEVPYVDLAEQFAELPDVRPLFYDTMHTTVAGRRVIADALEQGLERHGLLAPPRS